MLDLPKLATRYQMEITGVIHVGAHHGQEFRLYERLGAKKIVAFEPCSQTFQILQETVSQLEIEVLAFPVALGSSPGTAELQIEIANSGASNSLLPPLLHLKHYPHIKFHSLEPVQIDTLDRYASDTSSCNLLCVDVQGYELEVFRGAEKTLPKIDYIISEVNIDHLYEGGALLPEIDAFLGQFGFFRVEQVFVPEKWGDALYVKR